MVTLNIGQDQRTIGAHGRQDFEAGAGQDAGLFSHLASAAHAWADRYADYKYNQTDWRTVRP